MVLGIHKSEYLKRYLLLNMFYGQPNQICSPATRRNGMTYDSPWSIYFTAYFAKVYASLTVHYLRKPAYLSGPDC